ncbi:MAG: hypothetical protein JKY04_05770, partial [Sneathiella sp.]|nr:hypothetical protein [Sneathiella sp.]
MVKLLFADMYTNVSLSRMPAQFRKFGAENFGLGYKERLLLKGGSFEQKYRFPNTPNDISFENMVDGLTYACQQCNPDFLLTIDENLIRGLLHLRNILRDAESPLSEDKKRILSLLEVSLAPDENAYRRDVSVQLAEDAGFNIPEYTAAHSLQHLESSIRTRRRPFFIKLNFASGGMGVYPVSDNTDIKNIFQKIEQSSPAISDDNPAIVQSMAEGNEITVSFAAWKGELLGYIVVNPLERLFKNGPSTVVQ